MTNQRTNRNMKSEVSKPDEPSLNRSLDMLEDILDIQQEVESEEGFDSDRLADVNAAESQSPNAPDMNSIDPGALEAQYTIPLLNDVVLPGASAPPPESMDLHEPDTPLFSMVDDEDYRRLVERLTSELEVIVQAGVEDALQNAQVSISRQVKDHIDIMLPEILEELAQLKRRGEG